MSNVGNALAQGHGRISAETPSSVSLHWDSAPLIGGRSCPEWSHRELGQWGEELAVWYLRRRGLVIIDRNWRWRSGELDIVAEQGHRLAVMVEVKTRRYQEWGGGVGAITAKKRRNLREGSALWLQDQPRGWAEIRIDLIDIAVDGGISGDHVLAELHQIESVA